MAQKKELDALKEKKLKEAKEHEAAMRARAANVGNIVGPYLVRCLIVLSAHRDADGAGLRR